jgi:hypothetical protein
VYYIYIYIYIYVKFNIYSCSILSHVQPPADPYGIELKQCILPVLLSVATSTRLCPDVLLHVAAPAELSEPGQLAQASLESSRSWEVFHGWPTEIPRQTKNVSYVPITWAAARATDLGESEFVFSWRRVLEATKSIALASISVNTVRLLALSFKPAALPCSQ